MFVIKRVFPIFKKVDVTSWNISCDGGVSVTDTRVDVVFDGGMCSEGVRVHGNETRSFIKMSEIAFLASFDCLESLHNSLQCTDVIAVGVLVWRVKGPE